MKKLLAGILGVSCLATLLANIASAQTTDIVQQAQNYSAQTIIEVQKYYNNGQCSLIGIDLNFINKNIDAMTTANVSQGNSDAQKISAAVGIYTQTKNIVSPLYDGCHEGVTQPMATPTLSDILGNKNQVAIQYLYDHKVINGYTDGTFQPLKTVNRAELIKILVGGGSYKPTVDQYHDCFKDVSKEWFAPYVCYAKNAGWVSGYSDGTFKPSQDVNKVEALKMLVNSQNYVLPSSIPALFDDANTSAWYTPYLAAAKNMGLLEETTGNYGVNDSMTRGEISENIYRAMILPTFLQNTRLQDSLLTNPNTSSTTTQTQVTTPTQQTSTPVSTSTSSSTPINLSGTGNAATQQFALKSGLAIFTMQYTGSSNFIVHLLDKDGNTVEYLANEIGNYTGSQATAIPSDGNYLLNIEAGGAWTISISQPTPTSASTVTNLSGKGATATQIFSLNAGLHTFSMTHDGTSNFIVHLLDINGNTVSYLANEIGNYTGSQAVHIDNNGLYIFNISADGNWTVQIN